MCPPHLNHATTSNSNTSREDSNLLQTFWYITLQGQSSSGGPYNASMALFAFTPGLFMKNL